MVKRNFFGVYKGIELTTNGCEGNHNHFTGIEMDYKNGEVKISYCMFCWYLWYLMDRMLWTVVCYSNTHIWYVGITSYLRSFIVIYIYMSIINQPFWGSPILGNQPIFIHDIPWYLCAMRYQLPHRARWAVIRALEFTVPWCAVVALEPLNMGSFSWDFHGIFFWGFTLTIHYN